MPRNKRECSLIDLKFLTITKGNRANIVSETKEKQLLCVTIINHVSVPEYLMLYRISTPVRSSQKPIHFTTNDPSITCWFVLNWRNLN